MIEVRFHGRGGQGAVTAATILADAIFREGRFTQKIPFYGGERRGAPVSAFVRVNEKPIRRTSAIYNPDCIVVLDPAIRRSVNVEAGLKRGGVAVLNDPRSPTEVVTKAELGKLATVDATGIAVGLFGPSAIPITNTIMLGAFSAATGWVRLESLFDPVREAFPGALGEKNVTAVRMGFDRTKVRVW